MKGINFSEQMFHATIEGRKTMFRRIMKVQPLTESENWKLSTLACTTDNEAKKHKGKYHWSYIVNCQYSDYYDDRYFISRYRVWDQVYMKEPYFAFYGTEKVKYKYGIHYEDASDLIWKNPLFMPEKYARYYIEITSVRCERVQDISDEDCLKEGVRYFAGKFLNFVTYTSTNDYFEFKTPQEAYADLFDKINGKGAWESNPYVWVYSYQLVK